jgi:predicted CxxxxCH...CXXCH cytochrome family protein
VHIALNTAGTPISCATCHNGLGSGTVDHYNRAGALRVPPGSVAFLGTYDAQSGLSSFDNAALTCLNVSCHGGQANVNWQTGTLDVNTQCTSCHEVDAGQFNSPTSGEHDFHVNGEGFSCTVCHNTTTLATAHFTALSTPDMEGPASATIGGAGTGVATYVPGATPGTGSCTPSDTNACHNTMDWQ